MCVLRSSLPSRHFLILSVRRYTHTDIDWDSMRRDLPRARARITEAAQGRPIYVVCRRGNDSRAAVQQLALPNCFNVTGGLRAYAEYDTSFPMY